MKILKNVFDYTVIAIYTSLFLFNLLLSYIFNLSFNQPHPRQDNWRKPLLLPATGGVAQVLDVITTVFDASQTTESKPHINWAWLAVKNSVVVSSFNLKLFINEKAYIS